MQAGFKPPALAEVQEVYQLTNGIVFDIHETCFFFFFRLDSDLCCTWFMIPPMLPSFWSTKDAKYKGTWHQSLLLILNHWVSEWWILIFLLPIYFHKTFQRLQNLKLCPPTFFQKNVIRSFKSPRHILIIACCLGPFSSYFESRLSSFPPRGLRGSKLPKTKQSATYRDPGGCDEKMIPVTGW